MKNKTEIKAIMLEYLTSVVYPNITNKEIMRRLPNIFRLLDRKGLIPNEMNYKVFYKIVLVKYFEAADRGIV